MSEQKISQPQYAHRESDDLRTTIKEFSEIAGVPAFYMTEDGTVTWYSTAAPCFCAQFGTPGTVHQGCPLLLASAAEAATNLKEPHVFLCPSDMIVFACPKDIDSGAYFIGPLAMGTDRDQTIEKILSHFAGDTKHMAAAESFLSKVPIWTPDQISSLNRLLSSSLLPYQFPSILFTAKAGKLRSLQTQPDEPMPYTDTDYSQNTALDLLEAIQSGDPSIVSEKFRLFYEKTYLVSSGSFEQVRMKILEMFNYLSGNLENQLAAAFFIQNLEQLSRADTFNEVYNVAETMILQLTDDSLQINSEGTLSSPVRQALLYIQHHYEQAITLSATAEAIHISPSYLSMLFRRETGRTFSQYLTDLRLKHASRDLKQSTDSITEISLRNGFSSQSYFIRVFRRQFGMTPKQYRKQAIPE